VPRQRLLDQGCADFGLRRTTTCWPASGVVPCGLERRGPGLVLRGPLPCRRGGGNFPRSSGSVFWTYLALRQASPRPAATCAACSRQLQQQRFRLAGWSHPEQPAQLGAIHVQLRLQLGRCSEHFEASFFVTHAARAIRPAKPLHLQGPTSVPCRRLLAAATRQHRHSTPISSFQVVGELSGGSRSRQQCGTGLAPFGANWDSPSRGLRGNASVATGSIKAQFRSSQR